MPWQPCERWAYYIPPRHIEKARRIEDEIDQLFFDRESWFTIHYDLTTYGGWPPDYIDEQDHEKVQGYYEYVVKRKERENELAREARQRAMEENEQPPMSWEDFG